MTKDRIEFWWERLIFSIKHRGIVGTLKKVKNYCRLYLTPSGRRESRFDSLCCVDTSGRIAPWNFGVSSSSTKYSGEYQPTPVREFVDVIAGLNIDPQDWVFIDLGAGKGRALLLAALFPFKQIIGVEYAPALVQIAAANITSYQHPDRQCNSISVVCADASQYEFPRENLVLYLNNPFQGPILQQVVDNLGNWHRMHQRNLIVVYWNPFSPAPFQNAGFLLHINTTEQCHIYAGAFGSRGSERHSPVITSSHS